MAKIKIFSSKYLILILGLVFAFSSIFFWKSQEARSLSQIYTRSKTEAAFYSRETEARFNSIADALERMAGRETLFENPGFVEWEEDAKFYIGSFEGLKSIAWVDKTFTIQQVVPQSGNDHMIDKGIGEVDWNPNEINLWVPFYDDEKIDGYFIGIISISEIMSPVIHEIENDYMLVLSLNGKEVFESENWDNPEEGFVSETTITFSDVAVLEMTFSPTNELINTEKKYSFQIFFVSLAFSSMVLVAVYFAQRYNASADLIGRNYQNIIKNLMGGFYSVTLDGILLDYNKEFARILGFDSDKDLKGINLPNFWQDPGDRKNYLKEISRNGFIKNYLINAKKADGGKIIVQTNSRLVMDKDGNPSHIEGIFLDITKQIQAEEEKQKLEISLRQSQKLESIGTLASGVAHEINNPITGVMNYAQLIYERLEPSHVQLKEFALAIKDETERMAEIVRNLLTFSRHEKHSHSPARIKDIVNSTLSLMRAVLRKDQIELKVEIPDDLPEIKCRSQQIQQVLMNLLTNARHAVNDRYPEYDPDKIVSITVHQFEKDGRRWLRTTVEDHGCGIPAEISEQIFNPFFTTKDRTKGTGLGLSISQGIARDHHGELTFESEENKITRFYLDLPVDNGWENS